MSAAWKANLKEKEVIKTPEMDLYFVRDRDRYNAPMLGTHIRRMPNDRAKFAMQMMERFGLILADENGEDSAGRQKGRRLNPEECAALACDTSNALFDEMERRDWFMPVPSLEDMEAEIVERENAKENGGVFKRKPK